MSADLVTVAVVAAILLPAAAVLVAPIVVVAGIRGGTRSATRGIVALLTFAAIGLIAAGIVGTVSLPTAWMTV